MTALSNALRSSTRLVRDLGRSWAPIEHLRG
ncbi:hypothetical protein BJY28_001334 [Janibacter alkaliphilus]|uniref:Uncharacterized protein n=1 Tax=Janibacter alkaliphilus TaxID=1069963 RepID=A0A852XEE4_9MICO|nr:hypothetical protein [Janibacter alkaliphilus]